METKPIKLEEQSIEQLKVIAFDIDQAIKKSQNDYQAVINMINQKYQDVPPVQSTKLPIVDPNHIEKDK